ncbi:MAG: Crp/Fnr family transcriptional regulator [Nitrospirae bacterium]|nr:Crp/Fnr family transcriptional regulator [Nitrospirota bacterium]
MTIAFQKGLPPETSNQLSAFLKSLHIFARLNDNEIEEMKKLLQKKKFKKGQSIFMEGDRDIPVYIVESGKVKAYKCSSCGKEQVVRVVNAGDVLCLATLFCGSTCARTDALEDSIVYAIEKLAMLEFIDRHPSIAVNFLQYFASHMKKFYKLAGDLSLKDVTVRIMGLLLEHSVPNDKGEIVCTLTQKEIALFVGTVREVAGRALKKLQERGLIEMKYDEVVILKKDSLIFSLYP